VLDGSDPEHAVRRPTARVLVVDPSDRILLMEGTTAWTPGVWFTPGGGVQPGESLEAAAIRELWEETSWVTAAVGPVVWSRSHLWQAADGRWVRSLERFFWLRVPSFEPRFTDVSAREAATLGRMRWWSPEELTSGEHTFAPRRLAELLEPLWRGVFPAAPYDVGL